MIYTIGHSNRELEDFTGLLEGYGISFLVDVRSFPGSRHVPHFNKENLEEALPRRGIQYAHFPDLGGRRKGVTNSKNTGWHHPSFRAYADYMQTDAFQKALAKLIEIGEEECVVIMCAEAVPWRCHRRLISDALLIRNISVMEIIGEGEPRMHTLTPFARVRGQEITYPKPVSEE